MHIKIIGREKERRILELSLLLKSGSIYYYKLAPPWTRLVQ